MIYIGHGYGYPVSLVEAGLILIFLGFALAVVGILLIAASALLSSRARREEGRIRGAGVVLVGPIPIVAATDREMVKWGTLLTVVAAVLFLLLILLSASLTGK